jgi:hypothetical protein
VLVRLKKIKEFNTVQGATPKVPGLEQSFQVVEVVMMVRQGASA